MENKADETQRLLDNVVHLAELALSGRPQDVHLYLRRVAKRLGSAHPEASERLVTLLRQAPTRASPLRGVVPLPVDHDSGLPLVRCEMHPTVPVEPVFDCHLRAQLGQLVVERRRADDLHRRGLVPARTALFTGAPGVGKTLAARWLARELGLPLLVLDLSAVMSSFLGRTGNNVRLVLDYAKTTRCIVLLDELDAVAKRRDDQTEVGELKRLVTVLLQEIDDWPGESLLVAATNHAELLDPAVWRRFEVLIEFPMPSPELIQKALEQYLAEDAKEWGPILTMVFHGSSFSDIERGVLQARRYAALEEGDHSAPYLRLVQEHSRRLPKSERTQLAMELTRTGVSQRQAYELTGVSRDTIRDRLRDANGGGGTDG